MARKSAYTSIFLLDARGIAVLRAKLVGGKVSEVAWHQREGEWADTESLSAALAEFVSEKELKDDSCYLILPRRDVTTRFLTLPSHDAEEIAGMVRFSAEEYVPYTVEELIIDQCVLNPLESGESKVLAALAHHEIVERHITLFSEAGLHAEKIFLSTACMMSLNTFAPPEGRFALVSLDVGGIEITVFEERMPVFSRGIVSAQDWAMLAEDPEHGRGSGLLDAGGTEELASELRGSLSAYRRESADGLGVDDIYVACPYAQMDKFCVALSEQTGKNCQPAAFALDLLDRAEAAALPGIPLACIGALCEIMGKAPATLNLLPVSETKARRIQGMQRLALRGAVFALIICIVLGGLYFLAFQQRRQMIRELEARISVIEPNARGIAEKREALNILRRQVDRKGSILEQIARIVDAAPEGRVNFSRLSLHRNDGIGLWGRAKAVTDVAQFTQNIRSSADQYLEFFARARSLYEQQTMEQGTQVFAYQIEVSALEEGEDGF
ncbi:MAG: pilus assembly protein PilM [Candidatus Hydrogenedentes bacterium]|nr:pilus assembly protein PilM [Candidatus Hydrogenedentota bacterium]